MKPDICRRTGQALNFAEVATAEGRRPLIPLLLLFCCVSALAQDLKLFGKGFQLVLWQFFQVDQTIPRGFDRPDQFVELEMHRLCVAILGTLDEEDHDEGNDSRAGIDDQLPRVREAEEGSGDAPYD